MDLATTVEPADLPLHPGETGTVHVTITNRRRDAGHERKTRRSRFAKTELVDSGLGACMWKGYS